MRTHTVTLPDGKVETRKSDSREYAWVVIAKDKGRTEGWYAYRWSSTRALAEKAAAQWRNWAYPEYPRTVRVVPVESVEEREVKQGSKRPYAVWDVSGHTRGGNYASLEAARKAALKLQAEHPDSKVKVLDHTHGTFVADVTYELLAGELVEIDRYEYVRPEVSYVRCEGSGQRPQGGKFRSAGRNWEYQCHECGEWARYIKSREVLADHARKA